MLSNCPAPFPDELLYSLIARYRWLQKSDSHKWIIRRLFATKHALAVVDLPARLQSLHESGHLWAGWNNSKTLQRHTLFPLYTPCGQVTCQTKHNEWVRDRGPLWKFELERLWRDSRISLRQVARQLRVDSLTVKRQAAQLELPFPRKSKRTSGKNGPPKVGKHKGHPRHDLRQRQAQWLNLCSENQLLSTKNLRRLAPACYASLYRGCREWLKTHCPSPIRPVRAIARVDWHARDLELSQRVDRARKELLLESGPPRRISVAALGRQLRALAWIQKHSAKLPLTRAKLLNAQESAMDFARRRNFGTLPLEFEGSPAATSP